MFSCDETFLKLINVFFLTLIFMIIRIDYVFLIVVNFDRLDY